ncbi:MAG: proline--tRNA ligase [Negativicutes bacterium]|nr:proline--tRNA ligase [Negativicutes bacterium]
MLFTNVFAPTLREVPAEAEIPSHQLLLRAGFIRRSAGGVYSYLPLAWKVLQKIEAIVREEMNAKNSQELLMPVIQPEEIWQESCRWQVYGDEMWRLKDRHGRGFCLGPTHEELVTTLVRNDVRSYRQLPLRLYQIQNKYRDEVRPRFGLIRGREFIMKDMYSFDRDEAGLDVAYWEMHEAYTNIFSRCGLDFRPVEADSGAIGGSGSHEFMALADSGESNVAFCDSCDFAATDEKAELLVVVQDAVEGELAEIATPDKKTIAEVAELLGIPESDTIKAIAMDTDQGAVVVLVRGDHEVNPIKVQNALNCITVEMLSDERIQELALVTGFMGPIGLNEKVRILADQTVMEMKSAVVGANKIDYHLKNFSAKRDMKPAMVGDFRMILESDPCPRCSGGKVKIARGIEVGQIFKLYTKYSESLKCTFLDENGKAKPMVMGCYGIGVSRTMAAAVEQSFDKDGIIWPVAIAPYEALVVPVSIKDEAQKEAAFAIYEDLKALKVDVCLDNRDERSGVKFKDADLIGFPIRVVIGKSLAEGNVEIKIRKTGEMVVCSVKEAAQEVNRLLKSLS